jgi:hypothetical protein
MFVFDADEFFSWPTMLMFLFCIGGDVVVRERGRMGHCRTCSGWVSLLLMYIGMCLAGRWLSVPLRPAFGLFLGMHWAMYIGMVAGHLLASLLWRPFNAGLHNSIN